VLYSFKRRPIKPIANYDASVIYAGYVLAKEIVSLLSLQLMYSYLNEFMLEFYIRSLAGIAFLLGLTGYHIFRSFSNLHFLGLAFFYSRDVFGIGYQNLRVYM